MSIEAMKQALEALENVWSNGLEELTTAPMEALRAAIEQTQPTPLYTAPRQWQGLTEEEIMEPWPFENRVAFARWLEAKLKEKNT